MAQRIENSSDRWCEFHPKSRVFHGPMPVVPVINVALLIMLFVAMEFGFVLKPGIVVDLPSAEFLSGSRYGSMVVTLTQEGKVFFNDEWMPMDELEFAIKQASHRKQELSLVIEADARVPYGAIVRVMNIAAAAQIRQVDLATRPFFGEEFLNENIDR